MSNKLYLISRMDFGHILKTALESTYGQNVSVVYSDANQVIFTCPQVCDKVLRIYKQQMYYDGDEYFDRLYCSYADSWTDGTTLVNEIQFCGNSRSGSSIDAYGYISQAEVVLGESFIIVNFDCSRDQMALMGKLSNGQYLCMGFNYESGHCTNTHGFLTDGTVGEVLIPTISEPFKDGVTYVLLPIIFILDCSSIIKNTDGTFATMNGVYNAPLMYNSMAYQRTSVGYSNTYFISRCRYFYTHAGIRFMDTPLFCEVELGN